MYFGIALFCTMLFVLQFIFSTFGGDLDIDIDGDGSTDFESSGLFSFKGLLHFGIGFSWSMWFARGQENQLLAAIISVGIGALTAVILAIAYWAALKLKKEVIPEKGEDLVGRSAEIYHREPGISEWMSFVNINGSRREVLVVSEGGRNYIPGEKTIITKYYDGIHRIP